MSTEINSLSLKTDANLQGYWRMEDNFTDSGPNGYNLAGGGTPTYTTGKFGKSVNFVATSSQEGTIATATATKIDKSTSQSWLYWIKFSALSDSNYILGISDGNNWFMNGGAGGNISWSTGLSVAGTAGNMGTGVWNHVAFVYDSTAGKIYSYLNGTAQQNASVTGTITHSGSSFGVGSIGDYAGYGTFEMDDLAMFDRALNASEVQSIYKSSSAFIPFL